MGTRGGGAATAEGRALLYTALQAAGTNDSYGKHAAGHLSWMGRCLRSRRIGVLAVQVDSISHKNYQFRKRVPWKLPVAGEYQKPDCISCMPVQLKNNYCIVIIVAVVSVAREKI